MPLRDHFRPPVWTRSPWEGFHGGWPMAPVQRLSPLLPDDFTAEPRVHLGSYFEREVAARLGARVFDFTWVDDFAAARNESLPPAVRDTLRILFVCTL